MDTTSKSFDEYKEKSLSLYKTYIPRYGDKVDEALANTINKSDPANIKIMFIRESPGIYRYGSKKVKVIVRKG